MYSPQTGDVYLVAEHGGTVGHDLIALDPRTGTVRWKKDIDLPGPTPAAMQQRGALAITGGRVWVSFGAQAGDCSNYKGRLVAVRLDGTGDPVAYDPSPNPQGGIWNPAGPTVDAAGNLYVVTANGSTFPGDAYDHTNSVLMLSPSGKLLSSFAPTDWAENNAGDVGLGSQGVALVGNQWAVLGGKSGPVYVLRQGKLGGIGGQVSATDVCRSFGGAAVDGSVVYLPCTDGVRAVRVDGAGQLHVLWHAAEVGRWLAGDRRRARLGARPDRRGAARARPGDRADPRAGDGRRDQPVRHPGRLRQPGARPHSGGPVLCPGRLGEVYLTHHFSRLVTKRPLDHDRVTTDRIRDRMPRPYRFIML